MRLLLVEDNRANANLFTRVLQHAGYEVVHTLYGFEGLELACQQDFEAILMDLDLPDTDGNNICRLLRQARPNVPILAITATADPVMLRQTEAAGFDTVLLKPISVFTLIDTVHTFITADEWIGTTGGQPTPGFAAAR